MSDQPRPDARCVWITRAQREHLALYEDADGSWDVPGEIAAAWVAAPADPAEAVHEVIWRNRDWPPPQIADAVLGVLGAPGKDER